MIKKLYNTVIILIGILLLIPDLLLFATLFFIQKAFSIISEALETVCDEYYEASVEFSEKLKSFKM